MFIDQIKPYQEKGSYYVIGFILVLISMQMGQIPMLIAMLIQNPKGYSRLQEHPEELFGVLSQNETFFLILCSFAVAMAALFAIVKYMHKRPLLSLFTGRTHFDFKRFWCGFLLWGTISTAFILWQVWANPTNYSWQYNPSQFWLLVVIAVVMIPIQTTFEELFLRGYLLQGIALATKHRGWAWIGTSVCFGLLHIMNPEIQKIGYVLLIYYIGTGLFLGAIALVDEGLEISIGFHAANNLMMAILLTSTWSAFQTPSLWLDKSEPDVFWEIFIPVACCFPLLFFIFSKLFKWQNISAKLWRINS
ncbi:MAG: CPBP family intramembrane metalloprotease domain-containing protein [Flavobacterium sp. BFFFF2]|nr:MAG: CPBP family intramembrane metalloprotease domain-containing protein [Flavobacterium sp. BFFFF2]